MFPTPMVSPRTSTTPKNSINQSINQSSNQASNSSSNHSSNVVSRQASDQSIKQHVDQAALNQTTNQSYNQPTAQPISNIAVPPLYPSHSKLSSLSDRIKGRIAKYRHKDDQLINQNVSQSIIQSINQPTAETIGHHLSQQSSTQLLPQSTTPPVAQSTNQLLDQRSRSFSVTASPAPNSANDSPLSTEQPVTQTSNQPISQSINQSISHSSNSLNTLAITPPTNPSTNHPKLSLSMSNPTSLALNTQSTNQSNNHLIKQSASQQSISLLSPPHLKYASTQPINQSVSQTNNQINNQSINQASSQSLISNFSVARPMTPPRSPALNQSNNQAINLSSSSTLKTSPSNLSIKQLINQTTNSNSRIIVGTLHVRIVEARNLNHQSINQSKMRSFLHCEFEDMAFESLNPSNNQSVNQSNNQSNNQSTKQAVNQSNNQSINSSAQIGVNPFFGFEFTAPVTDCSSDCLIALVELNKLKRNTEIGSIVLSLTSLTQCDRSPFASHFSLDEWIELLPSNYDTGPNGLFERKWPSNEHRITGAGMRKPHRWPIGQLHVKAELEIKFPLMICYGLNPPIPPRKQKPKSNKKNEQLNIQTNNSTFNQSEEPDLLPLSTSAALEPTTDNNTDQSINLSPTLSDAGRASSPQHLSINQASNQGKPVTPLMLKQPANQPAVDAPPSPPEFHGPTFKRNFRRLQRFYATPAYWLHYARLIRTWESPLATIISMIFIYSLCFRTEAHHWPIIICFIILLIGFASCQQSSQDLSNILTFDTEAIPSEYLKEGALHKFRRWRGVLGKACHSLGRVASLLESTSQAFNFTDFHLSVSIYSIMFLFASFVSILFYFLRPGLVFFLISCAMVIDGLLDALKRWEIEHQTAERIEAQNMNIELSRKRAELMVLHQLNHSNPHSVNRVSKPSQQRPNSPGVGHVDGELSPAAHLSHPSNHQSSQSTPSSPLIKHSPSIGPSSNLSLNPPVVQTKRGFFASLRHRARPGLSAAIAQQANVTTNHLNTGAVDDFVLVASPNQIQTRARSDSDGRLNDLPNSHSIAEPLSASSINGSINQSTKQSTLLFNRSVSDIPFLNGNLQQMIEQREQELLDESNKQAKNQSIKAVSKRRLVCFVLDLFSRIHVWYSQYAWIVQSIKLFIKLMKTFVLNSVRRAPDQLELAHRVIGNRAMHSRINQTINQSIYQHEIAQHQLYQNSTINQSINQSTTQPTNRVSGAIAHAYQKLNQRRNANKQVDQSINQTMSPSNHSTPSQPGVWHAPNTQTSHKIHPSINRSNDGLLHSDYMRTRADSGASSQDHRWASSDSDSGVSSESETD